MANPNYSVFVKEMRMLMKFSSMIDDIDPLGEKTDWKEAVDHLVYGIRKFYAKEQLKPVEVYLKYGIMSSDVEMRKYNLFHLEYLKSKIRNINEVDTEHIKGKLIHCEKVRREIEIDIMKYIQNNPNTTEREVEARRRRIEDNLESNF